MVEQRTENPRVTGSIPVLGTETSRHEAFFTWKEMWITKKSRLIVALLLCMLFLPIISLRSKAEEEYDYLEISAEVKSFTETNLSWDRQDADEYIVYRRGKDYNTLKKVATIPGYETGYTVKTKKNKSYMYFIEGKKYGYDKKPVHVYNGDVNFYSGVSPFCFQEYSFAESKVSTKKIDLWIGIANQGMDADSVQIWRRKEGDKKFSKIKTCKLKKLKNGIFTDKSVEPLQTYEYKVRGVKKIGKKKYNGPFSEVMTKSAVRMSGAFKVEGSPDGDEVILKVTADGSNGDLIISPSYIMYNGYTSQTDKSSFYRINGVSLDGTNWISADALNNAAENEAENSESKALTIKRGESFWLRLIKGKPEDYDEDEYPVGSMDLGVDYNRIPSYLSISPYNNTGSTYQDSEAIH